MLNWAPAGRIDELTTVRSFSAELASTNSWVNPTVPLTVPPAVPMIRDTASTSSSRASGARNTTTDLPLSTSCTIRPATCASKSLAVLIFSLRAFFWSLRALIWECRSRFSSRSPDSSVSESRPEPSTTPIASARNTAASEIAW
ncbi:hypothetical protein C1Y40_04229 [Mycobacterium talmoniae]|uniref:Uncharacterized protein n=1 Tax=Mycobacterium talmoniae TaxID=1858794 RepID=A0A2S8BG84_9MYCO|nr:hypothetical protein C1Y40_04229 [Mycobacterium talmoniae]